MGANRRKQQRAQRAALAAAASVADSGADAADGAAAQAPVDAAPRPVELLAPQLAVGQADDALRSEVHILRLQVADLTKQLASVRFQVARLGAEVGQLRWRATPESERSAPANAEGAQCFSASTSTGAEPSGVPGPGALPLHGVAYFSGVHLGKATRCAVAVTSGSDAHQVAVAAWWDGVQQAKPRLPPGVEFQLDGRTSALVLVVRVLINGEPANWLVQPHAKRSQLRC